MTPTATVCTTERLTIKLSTFAAAYRGEIREMLPWVSLGMLDFAKKSVEAQMAG